MTTETSEIGGQPPRIGCGRQVRTFCSCDGSWGKRTHANDSQNTGAPYWQKAKCFSSRDALANFQTGISYYSNGASGDGNGWTRKVQPGGYRWISEFVTIHGSGRIFRELRAGEALGLDGEIRPGCCAGIVSQLALLSLRLGDH